ncbi:diacylglycerol/lipid kinase family protein [Mariniluteicoccus flavus]
MVNPVHVRGMRAADAVTAYALTAGRPLPRLLHTTVAEPGGAQARRLVDEGCTAVVAVGGDGTAREVAYAVAGTGVPLGIVPTGTANLFGRNVGLPVRLADRVRVAVEGAVRPVDLGVARLDGGPELPFLAYAGIGQDAATVAATRGRWKTRLGRLGWLAYVAAGARHLFGGATPMEVAYAGGHGVVGNEHPLWCVLVGNAGTIPAGITVFPGARVDDGQLHVMEVAGDVARWPLVAAEGVTGRAISGSGLRRTKAMGVGVRVRTPHLVQLDGDVVGRATAVAFAVRPGAVLVRAG